MPGAIGATIAVGWLAFWVFWFAFAASAKRPRTYNYSSASIASEEHNLAREFPSAYGAYKRSTKMLVPFLL